MKNKKQTRVKLKNKNPVKNKESEECETAYLYLLSCLGSVETIFGNTMAVAAFNRFT